MNTIEAIAERRSIRRFKDTNIPDGIIVKILNAGIQAPSGKNRQPWHFVVVKQDKRPEMIRIMREAIGKVKKEGGDTGSSEWTVALEADETLNDSDKTITVTAGQLWQVLSIRLEFTTTATVGDRQLVIQWRDDSDDIVGEVKAGIVQAASNTYYYEFAPALADLLAVRDSDWLMTPLPPTLFLPAGYDLRIWDNNAVDAAADDLIIQMMYAYKTV